MVAEMKKLLVDYSLREIVQNLEPEEADILLGRVLRIIKLGESLKNDNWKDTTDSFETEIYSYAGFDDEGIKVCSEVTEYSLTSGVEENYGVEYVISFEEADQALNEFFFPNQKKVATR